MSRRFVKRFFDLVVCVPALVVLLPVFLIVSTVLRLKPGSRVLFSQQRPGFNGKPFMLLKFCTMSDARDAEGRLLPDDQRLTRFGRFLRSSSVDELPELFNVLRGEMSLVGPRPLLMEYLELYTPEQMRRHEARPGITGWAQVNGRNTLSWEEKFKLDVWYVDHCTFWLDLKILAKTVGQIVRSEGISAPGHATAPNFRGSSSGRN